LNKSVKLDIIYTLPNGIVHADLYIEGNIVGRLFLNREEKQILEKTFGIEEKFLTELDDHM
jgi:hypothetical protein